MRSRECDLVLYIPKEEEEEEETCMIVLDIPGMEKSLALFVEAVMYVATSLYTIDFKHTNW